MLHNKIIKYLAVLFFLFLIVGPVSAKMLSNSNTIKDTTKNTFTQFDANQSVGSVVSLVIQAFLGLLGVIFVVLVVLSGYNWMTAGGDAAKIDKAKDTMQRAVIGLLIIIAAYSITYFVFKNLSNMSGGADITQS